MKPLAIELLPWPASPLRRRLFWTLLTLGAVGVAAMQGVRGWSAHLEVLDIRNQFLALPAPLATGDASRVSRPPPRYHADASQFVAAANFNVGRVLANVEAVSEQGVRLRSLDIDSFEAKATAVFEFSDLVLVDSIIETLNNQGAVPVWET